MATLRPFRALRPQPDQAAAIAAVPYDVVNMAEARDLAADNPLSFLRVSRPELELPVDTDPYADVVVSSRWLGRSSVPGAGNRGASVMQE